MRAVNLISKDTNRGHRMPSALLLVAALAPILAIGLVAGRLSLRARQGRERPGRARVDSRPGRRGPAGHPGDDSPAARRAHQCNRFAPRLARWGAREPLCALPNARRPRAHFALRRVADVVEPGVADPADKPLPPPAATTTTTTATTTTAKPAAPQVNLNALTIGGFTYSQRSVARLLTQLALLPMLSNVALTSSTALACHGPRYRWDRHYRGYSREEGQGEEPRAVCDQRLCEPLDAWSRDMNIRGSQKTFAIALGAAAGVILVAGILLVVLPQRSHASRLGNDTVAAEAQLSAARLAAAAAPKTHRPRFAQRTCSGWPRRCPTPTGCRGSWSSSPRWRRQAR